MLRKLSLVTAIAFLLLSTTVNALSVPNYLGYQGYITNQTGSPVDQNAVSVTFKIYDALSGGTLLWSETQTVNISKGLLATQLGIVNPLDLTFFV